MDKLLLFINIMAMVCLAINTLFVIGRTLGAFQYTELQKMQDQLRGRQRVFHLGRIYAFELVLIVWLLVQYIL